MANHLAKPNPADFGFTTFASLIGKRDPIPGEADLPFDVFHDQLVSALKPRTAYEAVIVESLIAIEWELLQHRRMRDVTLRSMTRDAICAAVVDREDAAWEENSDAEYEAWINAGNAEADFEHGEFDQEAAEELGDDLAHRIVDADADVRSKADQELVELGLSALQIMGNAYRSHDRGVTHHDDKIQELERRRRLVKADLDALQKARPVDVEVIEG